MQKNNNALAVQPSELDKIYRGGKVSPDVRGTFSSSLEKGLSGEGITLDQYMDTNKRLKIEMKEYLDRYKLQRSMMESVIYYLKNPSHASVKFVDRITGIFGRKNKLEAKRIANDPQAIRKLFEEMALSIEQSRGKTLELEQQAISLYDVSLFQRENVDKDITDLLQKISVNKDNIIKLEDEVNKVNGSMDRLLIYMEKIGIVVKSGRPILEDSEKNIGESNTPDIVSSKEDASSTSYEERLNKLINQNEIGDIDEQLKLSDEQLRPTKSAKLSDEQLKLSDEQLRPTKSAKLSDEQLRPTKSAKLSDEQLRPTKSAKLSDEQLRPTKSAKLSTAISSIDKDNNKEKEEKEEKRVEQIKPEDVKIYGRIIEKKKIDAIKVYHTINNEILKVENSLRDVRNEKLVLHQNYERAKENLVLYEKVLITQVNEARNYFAMLFAIYDAEVKYTLPSARLIASLASLQEVASQLAQQIYDARNIFNSLIDNVTAGALEIQEGIQLLAINPSWDPERIEKSESRTIELARRTKEFSLEMDRRLTEIEAVYKNPSLQGRIKERVQLESGVEDDFLKKLLTEGETDGKSGKPSL